MNLFEYFSNNQTQIITLLIVHIKLTAISVGLAIVLGVPLGILTSYVKKLKKPILGVANVVQAIPSMALLGFMIPLLGIGTPPAIVAVILYSLLPIIKNTYTGIDNINPQTLEAAKAIGLTKFQVLTKVQLPLALPVIMAGVRISAVTAVGLMTMAAFIGAGGLGYLVFSGIRSVNNNQILAGAIPACLLALAVDFLVGLVEQLVTPVSLQKGDPLKIRTKRRLQKVTLSFAAIVVVFTFLFSSYHGAVKNSKVISIGSKDFTEQEIVSNLVAEMIEEHTDISVRRRLSLGGTQVCFSALKGGDIDMYIEYSGSAYTDTLKNSPINNPQKVYDTVKEEFKKQYDITTLSQMAFNNTYVMAVTKETAEKYNLKTLSDFAKVADTFTSGTVFEFLNREDGLSGMQEAYNFKMKKAIAIDGAPRYTALINKEVGIIDAFATDALLKKFDLCTLVDDKQFFPPYYAMPIVRTETLEKYPEILPLIEELSPLLTNEVMTELNYRVDELQERPETVAHDFLVEQGLIN